MHREALRRRKREVLRDDRSLEMVSRKSHLFFLIIYIYIHFFSQFFFNEKVLLAQW